MANTIQLRQDTSKQSRMKDKVLYFASADGKTLTENYTFKQAAMILDNYEKMGIAVSNHTQYDIDLIIKMNIKNKN